MCRSLKVLCAAGNPDRLAELKQAVVAAHWELVGGAVDLDEVAAQVAEWAPDVVVIRDLGQPAAAAVRTARPGARVVLVKPAPGAAGEAVGLHLARTAILNGPAPAGPVRT